VVKGIKGFTLLVSVLCLASFASAEKLADPTKPYAYVPSKKTISAPSKTLRVTYIKHTQGGAVAYINGTAVQQGDWFQGMRVEQIKENGVQLRSNNKVFWAALIATKGITKK